MDWYYSEGQERKGPVSDEEFQRLVQQGVIKSQTLVWNESMADWKPYGPSAPPAPLTMAASAPSDAVVCAGCGGSFTPNAVVSVSGGLFCAACKPLALQRLQEGVSSSTGAEEVRKQYLKHEASVKSVGVLYLLGGILLTGMSLVTLGTGIAGGGVLEAVFVTALLLLLGAAQLFVGSALRRLRPWARIPTAVLSAIGLVGFPLGTIINGYILYLVLGKKGKMVFSPEYAAVMEQTPHIKYRTSILIWVLLGVVVLFIALGLGALLLGTRR
ncbi:MAG: DUF4339 domain-containing protein [Verrucomicrobiales bacterium]|nr:DUF4339 domain-containing protein [Verrucomicrobiales bacterium]